MTENAHGRNVDVRLPALNHFRYIKVRPDLHFASVDSGEWAWLDDAELNLLMSDGVLGDGLLARLRKSFIWLDDGNFEDCAKRLARRYAFVNHGPTLHIIVVTGACNLRCVYCQAWENRYASGSGHMSVETARRAVDRAFETPASAITIEFQGGEPLMNLPAIRAAVSRARQRQAETGKQVQFSLITNLTDSATDEALSFLIDNGIDLCFSLDGPAEIHDINRGKPGCRAQISDNIANYRRLWNSARNGKPTINALLTTTRLSLSSPPEIVQEYLDTGIGTLAIRPVTPVGRGRVLDPELEYTPDEFLDFWREIVAEVIRRRNAGERIAESHLVLFMQKLFGTEPGHMDIRSPCGAGIGQIVYTGNGEIHTCDEGRMAIDGSFVIGSVEAPLAEALMSARAREVFAASCAEQYFCDYCAFKPYCGVCPVLHQLDRGDVVGNPLSQRRCHIYGGMIAHILNLLASDENARMNLIAMAEESWS